MKMWYELTLNPLSVSNLYSAPPMLVSVEMFQIALNRDGPNLTMVIDGIPLPDKPPTKWQYIEYNKIQLALDFFEVSDVELTGWCRQNITDILIEETEGSLFIECLGSDIKLKFRSKFIQISKVTPYLDAQ